MSRVRVVRRISRRWHIFPATSEPRTPALRAIALAPRTIHDILFPRDRARESFALAKSPTYTLGSLAGYDRDAAPILLPNGYDARARDIAAVQIEKAGVRLARLLNDAFNHRARTDIALAPASDSRILWSQASSI